MESDDLRTRDKADICSDARSKSLVGSRGQELSKWTEFWESVTEAQLLCL